MNARQLYDKSSYDQLSLLFLSYLVYFRRYRHLRPSSLKKAKIHATVKENETLVVIFILIS